MKNLILSITDNYTYFKMSRFFSTLLKTGYGGHICLFVGPNTGNRTMAKLEKIGVEIIRFKYEFPYIDTPHSSNFKSLPNPIHLYNYRHFLYYDYLLKHADKFSNVMLTDIRDVVFQKDPFDFDLQKSICVAMENADKVIGNCEWNRTWMESGYGEEVMKKHADRVVSCAGTTFAPVHLMKYYLLTMLSEINQLKDAYECADQAVHNILIHTGRLSPLQKLSNENGPVLTLASEDDYKLNEKGFLVNDAGRVVNVIHQYDRHKTLDKHFNKLVYPWPLQRWITKRGYKIIP